MKRKLLAGAMIAACLSLAAYGTTAYFTTEATAENTITAGNIGISIQGSLPSDNEVNVMPGMETDKSVQVENTGDHPAYIRVRLDKSIRLADGVDGEIDTGLIGMNINTTNWTEKDGYYYYNSALEAGKTTEPLFTKVCFSGDMNDMYQNSKATITAYVAAVQSENNGADVSEASGWPAE